MLRLSSLPQNSSLKLTEPQRIRITLEHAGQAGHLRGIHHTLWPIGSAQQHGISYATLVPLVAALLLLDVHELMALDDGE